MMEDGDRSPKGHGGEPTSKRRRTNTLEGVSAGHDGGNAENVTTIGNGDTSKKKICVVSYNILCPSLSTPSGHMHAKPEHLLPENRFPKILAKLKEEVIDKGAICCLQEVGLTWQGRLQVFFERHGYSMVYTHYAGSPFADYMGNAICYPRGRFDLTDCSMERLSDVYAVPEDTLGEKKEGAAPVGPSKEKDVSNQLNELLARREKEPAAKIDFPSSFSSADRKFVHQLAASLGLFTQSEGEGLSRHIIVYANDPALVRGLPPKKEGETATNIGAPLMPVPMKKWEEETAWSIVGKRNNRVIMCKFSVKGGGLRDEFCVATYHNPCLFGNAEKVKALAIHTAWLMEEFESFAGSVPRILCGDFNFSPTNSAIYEWVTSGRGELAEALGLNQSEGKPPRYQAWTPSLDPMESAYAKHNGGKEPECTNYGGDYFLAALDYVFISKNDDWIVHSCLSLPTEGEIKEGGILPNEAEPSDHLLIGCELECRKFSSMQREGQIAEKEDDFFDAKVNRHNLYGKKEQNCSRESRRTTKQ